MTEVTRDKGSISDDTADGKYSITLWLDGEHTPDADLLDRILQNAMIELGIDTSWQVPPPDPTPEELPPPVIPPMEDVPPENQPIGEV